MFVFDIMLYNIRWYTLIPPQILQFAHVPRKIPSIAFRPVVSSMGRASSTAVCCMDEVCSSVGTVLGNIHHSGSNPRVESKHHPISACKIHPNELRLLWDHSMNSWPIQPPPIAYWYYVRKFCKWNGLNPPKTTRLSHHSDVPRLRNPLFRGLTARTIYRA